MDFDSLTGATSISRSDKYRSPWASSSASLCKILVKMMFPEDDQKAASWSQGTDAGSSFSSLEDGGSTFRVCTRPLCIRAAQNGRDQPFRLRCIPESLWQADGIQHYGGAHAVSSKLGTGGFDVNMYWQLLAGWDDSHQGISRDLKGALSRAPVRTRRSTKPSVAPSCLCRFLVLPSVTLSINTASACALASHERSK